MKRLLLALALASCSPLTSCTRKTLILNRSVPNAFEQCKAWCEEHEKGPPKVAVESGDDVACYCTPLPEHT